MSQLQKSYSGIKTQSDAVIFFIRQLDIEMIDLILDETRTYQDFPKEIFIHKLRLALDMFIASGDTLLSSYPGKCDAQICHYGCKGFSFIGNVSDNYLDLIIEEDEGTVLDIYECKCFKICDEGVKRKKRWKLIRCIS